MVTAFPVAVAEGEALALGEADGEGVTDGMGDEVRVVGAVVVVEYEVEGHPDNKINNADIITISVIIHVGFNLIFIWLTPLFLSIVFNLFCRRGLE